MTKNNTAPATRARTARPPTTPPAIAPTLVFFFELPALPAAEVGLADEAVVGVVIPKLVAVRPKGEVDATRGVEAVDSAPT